MIVVLYLHCHGKLFCAVVLAIGRRHDWYPIQGCWSDKHMGLVGGGMLKVMQSNEPVDLFLLPGTSAFKYCLIFTTPKIFYTDFSFGTSFYVKCMTVQGQA